MPDFGSSCLRRIRDIFDGGHLFEHMVRRHLIRAGFCFAPSEKLSSATFNGAFRGRGRIRRHG
jgi:hypothetical protein